MSRGLITRDFPRSYEILFVPASFIPPSLSAILEQSRADEKKELSNDLPAWRAAESLAYASHTGDVFKSIAIRKDLGWRRCEARL